MPFGTINTATHPRFGWHRQGILMRPNRLAQCGLSCSATNFYIKYPYEDMFIQSSRTIWRPFGNETKFAVAELMATSPYHIRTSSQPLQRYQSCVGRKKKIEIVKENTIKPHSQSVSQTARHSHHKGTLENGREKTRETSSNPKYNKNKIDMHTHKTVSWRQWVVFCKHG